VVVGKVGAKGVVAWYEGGGRNWGEEEATFVFADEGLNCSFAYGRGDEDVAGAEFRKRGL
jgi:hypothetical protein